MRRDLASHLFIVVYSFCIVHGQIDPDGLPNWYYQSAPIFERLPAHTTVGTPGVHRLGTDLGCSSSDSSITLNSSPDQSIGLRLNPATPYSVLDSCLSYPKRQATLRRDSCSASQHLVQNIAGENDRSNRTYHHYYRLQTSIYHCPFNSKRIDVWFPSRMQMQYTNAI